MTRLQMDLCKHLAAFVGSAIEVGADDEMHSDAERETAKRLSDKLRDCPKGARIIVEPIE
jgi:hypothetical protein